jgi:hypothetical protein
MQLISWVWWLSLIISAIWEAEIRRLAVPGQCRQKVFKTPCQLIKHWA